MEKSNRKNRCSQESKSTHLVNSQKPNKNRVALIKLFRLIFSVEKFFLRSYLIDNHQTNEVRAAKYRILVSLASKNSLRALEDSFGALRKDTVNPYNE